MEWGFALLLAVGITIVLLAKRKSKKQSPYFDQTPPTVATEEQEDFDENGETLSEVGEVRVVSAADDEPEPAQLDMLMGGDEGRAVSTSTKGAAPKDDNTPAEHVIIFHIAKRDKSDLGGLEIRTAAIAEGLILDNAGFFTRRSQQKKVLYRIANMMKPGYFDGAAFETMTTKGMTLFLGLPGDFDMKAAFEDMLITATELAKRLDAVVLDEQHVMLNEQMARYEHDRVQKIIREHQG